MSKKEIAHRSEDDEEWVAVRNKCRTRDKNMCCICRLITPGEYAQFLISNGAFTGKLDVAHIDAVGSHVEKTYDLDNVALLCRCHHQRMDSMEDPVTGKKMKKSDREAWWERVRAFIKKHGAH